MSLAGTFKLLLLITPTYKNPLDILCVKIGGPLTKISYQMIGMKCNNKKLQIVIDFVYCYFCSTSIVQSILAQKEN
ncbi:hypothetical protein CLOSTMETH_00784 [[Clostridium] methylpentosum DSM 5476]|uniref:Uncharacterized protein n=1 Tax=[Clostridium] methylpentosum DSM 5476 TaxID=537013 RepID=C0EAD0_9FIRM|nr:hypothetical protein CLOSTMETH_00784 [[Clostridium] methylpentosum DSM 5476]